MRVRSPSPCAANFTTTHAVAGGANTPSFDTYTFACDTGYTPSGNATCTAGAWDTPTCDVDLVDATAHNGVGVLAAAVAAIVLLF